jgi:hypothetical protein
MDAKQRESNEAGEQPHTGCRFRPMRRPPMIPTRMRNLDIRRLHRLRRFRLRVARGLGGKNAIWRNLDSGEVRMGKRQKKARKNYDQTQKRGNWRPLSRYLLGPFHLSMPFLRSLQLARHSFSDGWPFRGHSGLEIIANTRRAHSPFRNIGPAGFEPTTS